MLSLKSASSILLPQLHCYPLPSPCDSWEFTVYCSYSFTTDFDFTFLPLHMIMLLFMQLELWSWNMNPKFRNQNGVGIKFSCLHCRKKPKIKELWLQKSWVYGGLSGTTKNEPKIQGCLTSVTGKSNPWTGPEFSRRLRLLDFRQSTHEGGKVVSPM